MPFDKFYKGYEKLADASRSSSSFTNPTEATAVAMGRFAEHVRGGQLVLADLTGDGVPDLVQVTKQPGDKGFLAPMLLGTLSKSDGLRFVYPSRPPS